MPQTPDVSDNWSIDTEDTPIGAKITAEHVEDGLTIVVKEYPNGVQLEVRRPANLPGGYSVVHDTELDTVNAAIGVLEKRASMYDARHSPSMDSAAATQ